MTAVKINNHNDSMTQYLSCIFLEIVGFIEFMSTSHVRLDLIQVELSVSEVGI